MRWIVVLGITLATFAGCSLEEALENAPCMTDEDCLGAQSCVKTAHEEASNEAGLCRSSGTCLAGQQHGCITNSSDGCDAAVLVRHCAVIDGAELCFCCEGSQASISNVSADRTSAQCISCPSDLCTGDASEACLEGDARCVVDGTGTCGCRVPADQIENSECEDDASCGEGFVCVRTLEQEAEPAEAESLLENQQQEPGWCRPLDAPECAGGQQEGCRTDSTQGCPSSQNYSCTKDGRCYCCADPASSSFSVHVYAETAAGESAACVECPNNCMSPTPYACTEVEDAGCMVESGVCGCSASS